MFESGAFLCQIGLSRGYIILCLVLIGGLRIWTGGNVGGIGALLIYYLFLINKQKMWEGLED